jgi:hypothetical protein
MSRNQIVNMPTRLPKGGNGDVELALERCSKYLETISARQAFKAMYGRAVKYGARAIAELIHLSRDLGSGRLPRYSMRVPLSQPDAGHLIGGPTVDGNAAFWLSSMQKHASYALTPCAIWTDCVMSFSFAPMADVTLIGTWLPGLEDDALWSLGGNRAIAPLEIPSQPLRMLIDKR